MQSLQAVTNNGSAVLQDYMVSLSMLYQSRRKDSHRAANLDLSMLMFILGGSIMCNGTLIF